MSTEFPHPEALLPHSYPMVLVDEVLEHATDEIVCRVSLTEDAPFVDDGKAPGIVMIEYMAQTVGVWAGLRAEGRGEAVELGFLLGTRSLALHADYLYAGDELRVEATHIWGDKRLGNFQCRVLRGDELLAEGQLNVYQGSLEDLP